MSSMRVSPIILAGEPISPVVSLVELHMTRLTPNLWVNDDLLHTFRVIHIFSTVSVSQMVFYGSWEMIYLFSIYKWVTSRWNFALFQNHNLKEVGTIGDGRWRKLSTLSTDSSKLTESCRGVNRESFILKCLRFSYMNDGRHGKV